MKFLLLLAPFVLIGLSILPKFLIQRHDARLDDEAITEFHANLAESDPVEPTFEELWDAADDDFMKRWSSFCSRDLETENEQLVQRFAQEAEEVIQLTAAQIRWTYDAFATHFIRVDTTVELTSAYLVMKADGVDFDSLKERCDPNTDTMVWTEDMEAELVALLQGEEVNA